MCILKVANPRDSGEYVRFPATGGDGNEEVEPPPPPPPPPQSEEPVTAVSETMYSGYSSASEMSAMVSALTHVVSGHRGGDYGYVSGYGGAAAGGGGVTSSFGGGGSGIYSSPSPLSAYSSSSGSGSASGSASWVGHKRGRDLESPTQYSESIPRVYGGFGDFRVSHSESSSGATG